MTVLKTKVDKVAVSGSQRLLNELPREKLAWMLQRMCEIRYFEEKAEDLYVRGLVHGTMHLSIGQEAGSVGSIATLQTRGFDHPSPSRAWTYDCQGRQPDD